MVRLKEYLAIFDCVISIIEDICVRCSSVDKVTGSGVLNILLDVFIWRCTASGYKETYDRIKGMVSRVL